MSVVYGTGGIASMELETLTDGTPAVRVTVSGVAASTTFTLSRLCEGESFTVPGWRERTFTDSEVYTDWCTPTDRPVTYSLSAGGVVVASATITLPGGAWLQDPLQPDMALPVITSGTKEGFLTMRSTALQSITYDPAQQSTIPIMGSKYPVAFGGQVQAPSGVDISVRTDDKATADKFRAMRTGSPIFLLRTSLDMDPLPALCYMQTKFQEQPITTKTGGTRTWWSNTGDLVAPVMQAAITGSVTWDEVEQMLAGSTFDDVDAKSASVTFLDWDKNPLIFSTL